MRYDFFLIYLYKWHVNLNHVNHVSHVSHVHVKEQAENARAVVPVVLVSADAPVVVKFFYDNFQFEYYHLAIFK